MPIVSISEAAKLAGKDRKTIQRHIRAGKLSATQFHDGSPGVEISELLRCYGTVKQEVNKTSASNIDKSDVVIDDRDLQIAILKAELAGKNELIQSKDELIQSQKETISQQNIALLTFTKITETEKPAPKKSLLKRLFGIND